jgi:hypothetical protein
MKSRLLNFLNQNNLLSDTQFGFRHRHSTTDALLHISHNIQKLLNSNLLCAAIFIDFQKAFDSISHSFLLNKLYNLGIRGIPLKLFSSYLSNRSCQTKINSVISNINPINLGVPQGSVLGPILFLLFINDLPLAVNDCLVDMFADDTSIIVSGINIEELNIKLKLCSSQLSNWVFSNNLVLNYSKTKIMFFNKKLNFDFLIDSNIIESVKKFKLLGIYIDYQFKFKEHYHYIFTKLCKYMSLFYNIRNKLNCLSKRLLYYSMIQSILNYGILIFGNSSKTNLKLIQTLQNSLVKILFKFKKTTNTTYVYKKLNILTFRKLYLSQVVVTCLKMLFYEVQYPLFYNEMNEAYKSKSLKQKYNFCLPFSKFPHKDVSQLLLLEWNKLPNVIKNHKNKHKILQSAYSYIRD